MQNQYCEPLPRRTDAEIERDVRDALNSDVRIDGRDVDVVVQDGVIRLLGAVPDANQKTVAREVTARIKGVRNVILRELAVTPTTKREDPEIAADVTAALTRDSIVDERHIEVSAANGIIYLRGIVDSYTERKSAEADARTIPGVLDVIDEVTVTLAYSRSDDAIVSDVRMALQSNIAGDLSRIQLSVEKGVVHLTGSVATVALRWLVDEAIRWTPGVADVVNDLEVVTLQGP
jgi:osmotically-inducible protein OsmY